MLRLDAVQHEYSGVRALDGLSLVVEPGRVHALLGPNGAGKSTAVAVATGLVTPRAGRATIDRRPVSSPHARSLLGVAPQSGAVYHDLTARENVDLFGAINGVPSGARRGAVASAIDRVGLSPHADRRAAHLSEGMRRRLSLAAAIVHEPKVVMLDEPTAGVDPHARQLVFDLVRDLAARGAAILYTTHLMEEAERLAHTVTVIDRGRAIASGDIDSLIAAHGGETRVTIDAAEGSTVHHADDPVPILSEALAMGEVRRISVDRPSLEDVFFSLTGRSLRD